MVDVGSSTVGTTVNQDFIRNLAVTRPGGLGGANRSFDSLAAAAPQAATDVYGISISGATSPENSYLIDGLSVNNPAYGVNGTPLTVEFIDEVNVITGGYMPEYGRTTGGAISAVTKSGGNEFHGSVCGTWTPGGLTGPRQDGDHRPAPVVSGSVTSTTSATSARRSAATSSRTSSGSSPASSPLHRYSYTRQFYSRTRVRPDDRREPA